MRTCQHCQQPITVVTVWSAYFKPKPMSLDPDPAPGGEVRRGADGRWEFLCAEDRQDARRAGEQLYPMHASTCPSHRRWTRPATEEPPVQPMSPSRYRVYIDDPARDGNPAILAARVMRDERDAYQRDLARRADLEARGAADGEAITEKDAAIESYRKENERLRAEIAALTAAPWERVAGTAV